LGCYAWYNARDLANLIELILDHEVYNAYENPFISDLRGFWFFLAAGRGNWLKNQAVIISQDPNIGVN
jgi:hypothetical protein